MSMLIDDLVPSILVRDRRAIARALSLVESTSPEDREAASELLEELHKHRTRELDESGRAYANCGVRSRRIGITGSPGVGKSTFIEAWGTQIADAGHKVAVLAVDPSSRRTGGSILGDKVRMPKLSVHDNVYVRPSPSRLALGGTTTSMREGILVCEAAGFDTIIIETVGVGQSESDVADMVDLFVLLAMPNAGDDVQGIKRGIMEMADMVVVTKSDVDAQRALLAVSQFQSALRLMLPSQPGWTSSAMAVSSVTGDGLDAFNAVIDEFFSAERVEFLNEHRAEQRRTWFTRAVQEHVVSSVLSAATVRERIDTISKAIDADAVTPSAAIRSLLASLHITITEAS